MQGLVLGLYTYTGHLTETAFTWQSGVGPLFETHTAEDKCRTSAYGCIPDDKEGAKKPVHVRRNDVNLGQRISPWDPRIVCLLAQWLLWFPHDPHVRMPHSQVSKHALLPFPNTHMGIPNTPYSHPNTHMGIPKMSTNRVYCISKLHIIRHVYSLW